MTKVAGPTPDEIKYQAERGAEIGAEVVGMTVCEATERLGEEGFIAVVESNDGVMVDQFKNEPIPVPVSGRVRLRMKDGKVDGFISG